MSSEGVWRELEGAVLDGQVELRTLQSTEHGPVFSGSLREGENQQPVIVRFWADQPTLGSVLDRHREALFFIHPNLARCFGTGILNVRDTPFIYGVYEAYDVLFAETIAEGPMTGEDARGLARDIIDGLRYLHEQGLVYCNLDYYTVARKGSVWKLCDYSQLRPEGGGYANETRRLMSTLSGTPPEAFHGFVSPQWDSWGLAHLLKAALLGVRPPKDAVLEEPFAGIASDCLVADPGERCTLDDIQRRLDESAVEAAPPAVIEPSPEPGGIREISNEPARYRSVPFESAEAPPHGINLRRAALRGAAFGTVIALAAIFFGNTLTRPKEPVPAPKPAAPEASSAADEAARNRTTPPEDSQVEQVLDKWVKGFRAGDLNSQMALYAPRLERYFRMSNVSSDFVRRTKADQQRSAGQIRQYQLSNVKTQYTGPSNATVTFDKTWEFAGRRTHSGKVQGELKLEKQNGSWRIVSERDLKVYRQSKS